MITFDHDFSSPGPEAMSTKIPDEIECGENNDYWIKVKRSTKIVSLVSKQTGKVVTKLALRGNAWASIGELGVLGLTQPQIRAVIVALFSLKEV